MVRKAFTVTGVVQGVFFRKHLAEQAVALGLTGFVQNLPDGSVYAEAQGSEEKVSLLFEWCQMGSPASRVEMVVAEEMTCTGDQEFSIRR
ncbi:MAG: hypothetical protein RL220_1954 [Bacteroidota bacterium]|jgi:acylphosphatase